MATLDVTELLFDPDLVDYFMVLRRASTVNEFGETQTAVSRFNNVSGAVFSTGNNSLAREDASQTAGKTVSVITTFRLRSATENVAGVTYQPDVVVWAGNQFLVVDVNDYSRYGAGFVEATCASTNLMDVPEV